MLCIRYGRAAWDEFEKATNVELRITLLVFKERLVQSPGGCYFVGI